MKPVLVLPMSRHSPSTLRVTDVVVSTVSKSSTAWERQLSPFTLGPCRLYNRHPLIPGGHRDLWSINMENAWQFSKVYKEYLDKNGDPSQKYWRWAEAGWSNVKAIRYPMGKGSKPEYSYWDGRKLDYIAARKAIYGPLYANAVQRTDAWLTLRDRYARAQRLVLLDYDAYDHAALDMSLTDVLNNPKRKMGHAFVLAMLLQNDPALDEMEGVV